MAPDKTPIQHFAAKLLLISNMLLTDTGKVIGKKRHKLMVDYLIQYQKEQETLE